MLRLGFGTSPLLPILDVHYCSQLKELLKEQMIAKLFALCNELETHAKDAEYGCTTLQQVLEPMAFSYQEDMSKFPKVPEIISLNAYQLDYCVANGKFITIGKFSKRQIYYTIQVLTIYSISEYRTFPPSRTSKLRWDAILFTIIYNRHSRPLQ